MKLIRQVAQYRLYEKAEGYQIQEFKDCQCPNCTEGAHWFNVIAYQRLKSAEWWLRQRA